MKGTGGVGGACRVRSGGLVGGPDLDAHGVVGGVFLVGVEGPDAGAFAVRFAVDLDLVVGVVDQSQGGGAGAVDGEGVARAVFGVGEHVCLFGGVQSEEVALGGLGGQGAGQHHQCGSGDRRGGTSYAPRHSFCSVSRAAQEYRTRRSEARRITPPGRLVHSDRVSGC